MRGLKQLLSTTLVVSMLATQYAGAETMSYAETDNSNTATTGGAPKQPLVEPYLLSGDLRNGAGALERHLKQHSGDDEARFGLGMLQFLYAVEGLVQDLYKYGFGSSRTALGQAIKFSAPANGNPATIRYSDTHAIGAKFLNRLTLAEATLSQVTDKKVELPIHFGLIKLDFNGDGRASGGESLWRLYAGLTRNQQISPEQSERFYIKFDYGDVHWLRGYCHVLMALTDTFLAYNQQENFNCCAHLFFPQADTPYPFLKGGRHVHTFRNDDLDLVDLVALIHTINWKLEDPKHMESALRHLKAIPVESKESWTAIMAETDDDHEWLPNPRQTGVIPNVRVTEEMVTAWMSMMSELDKILAGKKLVRFWRGTESRGINVEKIFTQPRDFDLVLWIQGTAAAPYLEQGELTDTTMWRQLPTIFGPHFPGFAAWFN